MDTWHTPELCSPSVKRVMKIVAIMTIRNEADYLPIVLQHLHEQGILVYLIDNDSTDNSLAIAKTFEQKNVIFIDRIPYNGEYEWEKILKHKEKIAQAVEADWFIHHDADEILESPSEYSTLSEGIEAVDALGFNAINFDEFVFVPTSDEQSYEGRKYTDEMKAYYFFEPSKLHRIIAWKKQNGPINLRSSGGHQVMFAERNIFVSNFILRHYIALSREYLVNKYGNRKYSDYEVNTLGWHRKRARFDPINASFSGFTDLCFLNENHWDKSKPFKKHFFLNNTSCGHE
jgi:glycosyltransferase involved in cell wall biosynthesis